MTDLQISSHPRFLADENFNLDIVAGLRRAKPAIDILTAPEAGILHWLDPDVLTGPRRMIAFCSHTTNARYPTISIIFSLSLTTMGARQG
jgi:hypothetical protein